MKLRFNSSSSNIILNKEQTFRSNAGWDENFQTYEDEVLESIINPIENYETNRYIHKPYISNNIEQTDIWFYFYFVSGGTYTLDYKPAGISQTDTLLSDLKNSFFRLEFYKTPNNEPPNRSNRRLVFAKNLSTPVGERISVTGKLEKVYVPVFVGSTLRNKENMYLFWFHDDSVLEETLLTGTIFYMTAKFYNASDGSRIQFANKILTNSANLVEEEDLYFRVQINRVDEPSYHYVVTEMDDCDLGVNFKPDDEEGTTVVEANRVGTRSTPIKFYEIKEGTINSVTPTPTPTPQNQVNCDFDVDVTTGTTTTPTPTPATATISWNGLTSVQHGENLPGDNPSTGTTTGTITVTNGSVNLYVSVTKEFNYGNSAVGELIVNGVGTLSVPVLAGDLSGNSLPSVLTIPPGIYPYTINSILQIISPNTSGQVTTTVYQQ